MASFTNCVVDVPGGCCHTSTGRGRPSTAIFVGGAAMAPGNSSTPSCANAPDSRQDVNRCRQRPSLIANQRRRPNKEGRVALMGAKKINGRKRHILVDTSGLLLKVIVHQAGLQDREGAKQVLMAMQTEFPTITHVWADMGYTGTLQDWMQETFGWKLTIVKRPTRPRGVWAFPDQVIDWAAMLPPKGFHPLPRRWVVERTFAWLGRNRRLSKDYERLTTTEEAWMYLAGIRLMLHRLVAPAAKAA
jgi:putative transposase